MSNKSNDLGRAFEYTCLIELKHCISGHRPVEIDERTADAARRAWETVSKGRQSEFLTAAAAFVDTLFEAESLIPECDGYNDIIELSINKN